MEEKSIDIEAFIALLNHIDLTKLEQSWIEDVINGDFTEINCLPAKFEEAHESTNFQGLFKAIIDELRSYIDTIDPNVSHSVKKSNLSFLCSDSLRQEEFEKCDEFTKFWRSLTKSLHIRSLQAFLHYYMYKAYHNLNSDEFRELGINAASIYCLFLSIPGSNAYQFFHPIIFMKSLDLLKLPIRLNLATIFSKKNNRKIPKNSYEDMDNDNGDDEFCDSSILNPNEANKLIRILNIFLNDFTKMLMRFSLKNSPEGLEESVNVLVQITRLEAQFSKEIFLQRHSPNSITAMCYNAYAALQAICNNLHGDIVNIVKIILKEILESIITCFYGSGEYSSKALNVVRDHSVIFTKYIIVQLKAPTYPAVFILLQHLCLRVIDKAEFREKTAKSVIEILFTSPVRLHAKFLLWLFNLSQNERASHRLFTLEVVSQLLEEHERYDEIVTEAASSDRPATPRIDTPISNNEINTLPPGFEIERLPEQMDILTHKFLLSVILSRCKDNGAVVSSKAISLVAECILSNRPTIINPIKNMFLHKEKISFVIPSKIMSQTPCQTPTEDDRDIHLKFSSTDMIKLLRKKTLDQKVTVRKSALQAIENLMKLHPEMVSNIWLKTLQDHCRDPALLIRKQMVTSIASLVEIYPNNNDIIKTWVFGILPMILDPEAKVQEKVVEFSNLLIFNNIFKVRNTNTEMDILPWRIIDMVTDQSYHKFLDIIVMMWSKSGLANRTQIIGNTLTHIGTEFNEQAWTLLAILSQYLETKSPIFAYEYFSQNFKSGQLSSYTMQQVLKVLSYNIKHIPLDIANELQASLIDSISECFVSVEMISSVVEVIALISYKQHKDDIEAALDAIEAWCIPIIQSCDEQLREILFPNKPTKLSVEEEEKMFRNLYTMGEVSQLAPNRVNKRMFLMLQSLIFHDKFSNDNAKPANAGPAPSSQTQSTQPPAISFVPTTKLQNLAVVTLGKMCLQHEDQAKRIVPALGQMLATTKLASLKINIVFVLSDMCVRYATVVDPLLPQVTSCLKDNEPVVRRTVLTSLINLLQEDYLKLKDSFFYRILQCLIDSDSEVRTMVEFFMTERILKRYHKIFSQHFIECIFHYNSYEELSGNNRFEQTKQEKELFNLSGNENRKQRFLLYNFMLEHMPDDQRFSTTQRLCQDILGAVVENRIKLTQSSIPMLEDTLLVLSSDEIKLASLKSAHEHDLPSDVNEQAQMAGMVIKKTIISQVVKRNVIENIIPILIAMKQKLEECRSPLMKQLLLYFKEIMKDYKNEVKEILAGDKLIQKEIEFDLQKLEEEEKRIQEVKKQELKRKQDRERELERNSNNARKRNDGDNRSEDVRNSEVESNFESNLASNINALEINIRSTFDTNAAEKGESSSASKNTEESSNNEVESEKGYNLDTPKGPTLTMRKVPLNLDSPLSTEIENKKTSQKDENNKTGKRSKKGRNRKTAESSKKNEEESSTEDENGESEDSSEGSEEGENRKKDLRKVGKINYDEQKETKRLENNDKLMDDEDMEVEEGEKSKEDQRIDLNQSTKDNVPISSVEKEAVKERTDTSRSSTVSSSSTHSTDKEITSENIEKDKRLCVILSPVRERRVSVSLLKKALLNSQKKALFSKSRRLSETKSHSFLKAREERRKSKHFSRKELSEFSKESDTGRSSAASKEMRKTLLRAISTPNKSIIKDVTFMNRTQDVSFIEDSTKDPTESSNPDKPSSNTLVLHLKSPEAFAKEDLEKRNNSPKVSIKSRRKDTNKTSAKKLFREREINENEKGNERETKRRSGNSSKSSEDDFQS